MKFRPLHDRVLIKVRKCLQSAIANAENNHNLDVDELVIVEAYVGKNITLKRGRPRARGRFGRIIKPFSELTIKVRQVEEQARAGRILHHCWQHRARHTRYDLF